jgi:Na+/H+ antiporter NhaD/arsenite permease-like protein
MTSTVAIGADLPVAMLAPFCLLLAAIAVLPLVAPRFWGQHRNQAWVVLLLAVPVLTYLPWRHGAEGTDVLVEKGHEYVSFILLLGSLYVIAGGIHVRGSLAGTPLGNTVLLALGAVLASLVGTTGASMLLIYPLLRANQARRQRAHIVVFFIFIVANCGGLLTPLGDPPLFLGYLKGVPFDWTLGLWPQWLLVNGVLIAVFNVWDQIVFAREERSRPGAQFEAVQEHRPLRIDGVHNLPFLVAMPGVVWASGSGIGNGGQPWPFGLAEAAMCALAAAAWYTTHARHREANGFSFAPIVEVAVLFAGLFATMAPALLILNARAAEVGLDTPQQFFWATGALSSVLDNAPTYLAFAATAAGLEGIPPQGRYLAELLARGPDAHATLAAIASGAVFMGANTYIGNGPNLMIKAIADRAGVAMPSFFGYLAYSGPVLLPLFAVTAWLLL